MGRPLIQNLFQTIPTDEPSDRFYLPADNGGEIVHHTYHSLAYNESTEQADWIAYELSRRQLDAPRVERTDYFDEDTSLSQGSASFYDYKGSGYTKGHLVPAADRAFSRQAMEETFLMSNISPQARAFNGGVWRELEESVRDWTRAAGSLYIVTGPIFEASDTRTIGENRVRIPSSFYKVILDADEPGRKAIGFVLPNERSVLPLQTYALSVDAVEEKTGIDFYHELFTDTLEDQLEREVDLSLWPISQARYRLRIDTWNKR